MESNRNEYPNERAPLLLVFGDLAGRVAALIRAQPLLIPRLMLAPRASVHATAIFLHLAPDAARPDDEVAAIINEADPRELLRAALPGSPPRLYRALDRAGDRVRDKRFYERVGEVSRGRFGDAFLGGGPLDDGRLGFFEALSTMDPLIASVRNVLPESRYDAEGVNSVIMFLRGHGALRDGDFHLPPKSGLPSLVRRLRRALDRIPAPDPGFVPPSPWRLIASTAELQRIGKALGNCVAMPNYNAVHHHFRLLDGTNVFLTIDTPPLLASLRRVGADLWVFEQMAGPRNVAPPKGVQAALLRDLTAAGLKIVETDPQSALSRLDGQTRRGRAAVEDDLEDEDEEDGEEDAEGIAA
jgi:hypothetical protein